MFGLLKNFHVDVVLTQKHRNVDLPSVQNVSTLRYARIQIEDLFCYEREGRHHVGKAVVVRITTGEPAMLRLQQATFARSSSTQTRIIHHITDLGKFADYLIHQHNGFSLRAKHRMPARWAGMRSPVENGFHRRQLRNDGQNVCTRLGWAPIRGLSTITWSSNLEFRHRSTTSEMHRMHRHVKMEEACCRPMLGVVFPVANIDSNILLAETRMSISFHSLSAVPVFTLETVRH